jgi:hypothetical protein
MYDLVTHQGDNNVSTQCDEFVSVIQPHELFRLPTPAVKYYDKKKDASQFFGYRSHNGRESFDELLTVDEIRSNIATSFVDLINDGSNINAVTDKFFKTIMIAENEFFYAYLRGVPWNLDGNKYIERQINLIHALYPLAGRPLRYIIAKTNDIYLHKLKIFNAFQNFICKMRGYTSSGRIDDARILLTQLRIKFSSIPAPVLNSLSKIEDNVAEIIMFLSILSIFSITNMKISNFESGGSLGLASTHHRRYCRILSIKPDNKLYNFGDDITRLMMIYAEDLLANPSSTKESITGLDVINASPVKEIYDMLRPSGLYPLPFEPFFSCLMRQDFVY